jgi:hypothetical protein
MSLVLRGVKGSKLTFDELDGNFTYLESISAGGVTNVSYSELISKISADELTVGALYKITDFKTCYDQPNFDYNGDPITSGNYREASVQPIIVKAITTDKLSEEAWQPDFPKDQIKYDVTFDETEITAGTAYGRITERIDDNGNRTDYDHRNILFKRYFSYSLDNRLSGWIYQVDGSTIRGVDTDFVDDLSEGDIVFLPIPGSDGQAFFEVKTINSATEIIVEGQNYYNFYYSGEDRGINIWTCIMDYENITGTLYYFNDNGDNNIVEGGNDMYDGGNYLNTNLNESVPYTHTQMSGVGAEAAIPDFSMDGATQSGSGYFGDSSNYFTNCYPGLFVMVATDCNIYEFYTSGNLGADSGGFVEGYTYSKTIGANNYKAFIKKIGGAGFDPSINQIIIVNTDGTGITHSYSDDTNDGEQKVEGLNDNGVTQVHYLLTALAKGVIITNAEADAIVDTYLGLIDGQNLDQILTTLNTSYTDITDCLPTRAVAANSYNWKQSNVIDNTGFIEVTTFEQVNAIGNWIGDFARYRSFNNYDFLLSNNVFGKTTDTSDCIGNRFGDETYNNTIGGFCSYNEVVGNFYNNIFYYDFYENKIGFDFYENTCLTDDFYRNQIGTDFYNNIVCSRFYRNIVGNDFRDNVIPNEFQNNFVRNQFNNNVLGQDFYKNSFGNGANNNYFFEEVYGNEIGNAFNNNRIYGDFYENTIVENLNSNTFYSIFYKNSCGPDFNLNTIGESTEIGNFSFYKNVIGNYFKGNTILGDCYSNQIGDNFVANNMDNEFRRNIIGVDFNLNTFTNNFEDNRIGNNFYNNGGKNNFSNNIIGNLFSDNIIGSYFSQNNIGNDFGYNTVDDYFGFGGDLGGESRGNRIGNYFRSNVVGEYFYDNSISDYFISNKVGELFQFNTVKNRVQTQDFTQKYGNIVSFTNNNPAGFDGIYNGLSSTSGGLGVNATFNVTVAGGVVTNVVFNQAGILYTNGELLVVPGSSFGGVAGVDNLQITVTGISNTPAVYTTANCEIIRGSDGNLILQIYKTEVGIQFIALFNPL